MRLYRLIVPGLVIMAVMVGGGYATGRELVEFFISKGPLTALAGLALTAFWISTAAMVSFELARRYQAFDYRSFCRIFIGPFSALFEVGYYALLLLVLSVVSAAAGKLLAEMAGLPEVANSILFMAAVAFVVYFGNSFIEKVISIWSMIFYATYGSMFALVLWKFGPQLRSALNAAPLDWLEALKDSLSYTGYNVVVVPVLIFVARNLETRPQALAAGAMAGPLILLPGFASLLALSAFYPQILGDPLPISRVLREIGSPTLRMCVQLVILGAFIKTGVGLLHGLNERVARAIVDRGRAMPRGARPLLALGIMVVAVFVASSVGIINLIGQGYRYSSYFFLVVFFFPLMLRGLWLAARGGVAPRPLAAAVLLAACGIAGVAECGRAQAQAAQQAPAAGQTSGTTQKPATTPMSAADIERELARLPKSRRDDLLMSSGKVPGPDFMPLLEKEVAEIPMRDGVTLHTEIYSPKSRSGALPIIYERTPYGLSPDAHGYSAHLRMYPGLIADGYIFALQDVRGTGGSGGEFVTGGPMRDRSRARSIDPSTDAYDSIDWLVKHVRDNNGRVGTLGISYGGFMVTRALVDPHPALKAASPQATCADMFVGDDWHHNGAFRLSYSFDWIEAMESERHGADRSALEALRRHDSYEQFLALGPLANVNALLFHGNAPSWNAFAEHPNNDDYWTKEMCGVLPYTQRVTVPTLLVAGYFDAEDYYGPLELYHKYETQDPKHLVHLVIGPWYHGEWSRSPDGRTIGAIDFGQDTSRWYRDHVQAPWFAHWLKGRDSPDLPPVLAFRTGENRWEPYEAWPPRESIEGRKLYLAAGGKLSFQPPSSGDAGASRDASEHDDYVSDPAKPVPYLPRPITEDYWAEWQLADQRFVDGRPDVLTYESEPLTEDLTVSGDPVAHLYAATTGSDADWVVKLIDVYPESTSDASLRGFELMVAGEVFRARYRSSFERPAPLVPGEVTAYAFGLRDRNHTFKAGHRIMVQVQSTLFPVIDRNPQRYVPSIYEAVKSDFRAATQSVYRSPQFPSYLSLPVNTRAPAHLPPSLPDPQ
jgi:putative CocE/NonD family hydrolase